MRGLISSGCAPLARRSSAAERRFGQGRTSRSPSTTIRMALTFRAGDSPSVEGGTRSFETCPIPVSVGAVAACGGGAARRRAAARERQAVAGSPRWRGRVCHPSAARASGRSEDRRRWRRWRWRRPRPRAAIAAAARIRPPRARDRDRRLERPRSVSARSRQAEAATRSAAAAASNGARRRARGWPPPRKGAPVRAGWPWLGARPCSYPPCGRFAV